MAEIRPFRGLRYNEALSARMGSLISPPYDVIPPDRQPVYRGRSPYNVIHVELPETGPEGDRYRHAGAILTEWTRDGILRFDDDPTVYLYGETFPLPDGGERTRFGAFALLRLEEFESGVVLPHEQTFPKHKEDRFRLISASETQISPIFGLYHAPGGVVSRWPPEIGSRPPAAEATDDEGVRHRLWPVRDRGMVEAWRREMAPLQVFIADGHHRYETALLYRAERRTAGGSSTAWYDYIMILLVEMSDPGLVLFPTHRLVRFARPVDWEQVRARLREWFDHREAPLPSARELPALLPDRSEKAMLGMLAPPGDRLDLWTLRDPSAVARVTPAGRSDAWQRLDVVVLHELVLGQAVGAEGEATYTRDPAAAIQTVRESADTQTAAFFVRPPSMEDLKAVALAGDRMPEKTTYFWPKATTGLVLYAAGGFVANL